MSSNLMSQFYKLELISGIKSLKARKILLAEFSSDDKFCKALREIVRNTVNKNVVLPTKTKTRLRRYRHLILQLQKKKMSNKRRRKMYSQTGTGVFIPLVVPIIAELFSSLLSK